MAYSGLREFIQKIDSMGELKRISYPADPYLEITEIADRVMKRGGPALLFENPKGSEIPLLINAYGSERRMNAALGVEKLDDIARDIQGLIQLDLPKTLGDKLRAVPKFARVAKAAPR
jgi:4-hydroxy-3-polyprenylbenzoate decarboxylase